MNYPSGTVTFLFTDIEGSTILSQTFPDSLQSALDRHHEIMQTAIETNNGFVFEIIGDAFCSAFQNAEDAVNAAVDAQINLSTEKWSDAFIKVRIGIHSGNAEWNGIRYMGYITLARTARVMSSAYGEQIVISGSTYELCKEKFIYNEKSNISFRDLGERRLKDVIQPIRLFQILSPGLRTDFPPLKTLDARPNNLPIQLTSFIGREAEIKEVKNLLKKTHLLTLTGSGGAGKTRFALQVAADAIDDFANGVFITELATVSDSSLLLQTIMNSLNLKEETGKSLDDTLTGFLKNKSMLLILDNCEHIINECAFITEMLLGNCPGLVIIATSRQALHCQGEQTYRIPSLSLPEISVRHSPEYLTQYEAVRLFIERALSVNPNFRVNNENAPALAGICNRLDGIPLAIELAAVRVKSLSLEKIYERLDDRFSLLTGGKRTALPRQQTLKALIDWSYDLLSEKEKLLWNRFSVFSGGWDLEAAEVICTDEKVNKNEIIDILDNLSEKSIILYDGENERYRMLETIRQYGIDKLKDANEIDTLSDAHLKYYLEFAETADSLSTGIETQNSLNKLDLERGNLEKSLLRAVCIPEKDEGLKLAAALGNFWKIRGHYSEGRQWLEKFLEIIKNVSGLTGAKSHRVLAKLVQLQGEINTAVDHLNKSIEISKDLDDKKGIAASLNNLGNIKFESGDYDEAQKYFEEGLIIYRETGDKKNIAYSLNDLCTLLLEKGEYDKAIKFIEEGISIQREAGEIRGIAYSLFNLGNIVIERGDFYRGEEIFEECIIYFNELDEKRGLAYSLCSLGNIALNLGDLERAAKQLDESLTIFRNTGEKRGLSFALSSKANVDLYMENYEMSSEMLDESYEIGKEIENKSLIAFALFNYGNLNFELNNYEEAKVLFEESLTISTEIGHKPGIAFNLYGLGKIAFIKGDIKLTSDFYEKSLLINKELNQKKEIAEILIGFSELKVASEKWEQAAALLGFYNGFSGLIKTKLLKSDSARMDLLISNLQKNLSTEEYSMHFEDGRKLTLDDAIKLALKN